MSETEQRLSQIRAQLEATRSQMNSLANPTTTNRMTYMDLQQQADELQVIANHLQFQINSAAREGRANRRN